MNRSKLTASQVRHARRCAWNGMTPKEISNKLARPYGPVWSAVRGVTWKQIADPPPIPDGHFYIGKPPRDKSEPCSNCGRIYKNGATGLCSACYAYQRRHGCPRPKVVNRMPSWSHIELPIAPIIQRYENGESVRAIAVDYTCSPETIRRRLDEAGVEKRPCSGMRGRLNEDMVRYLRHEVVVNGVLLSELSRDMGIKYSTLYSALRGHTWRSVEYLLPQENGDAKTECSICGLLTSHDSGVCRFCRSGQ